MTTAGRSPAPDPAPAWLPSTAGTPSPGWPGPGACAAAARVPSTAPEPGSRAGSPAASGTASAACAARAWGTPRVFTGSGRVEAACRQIAGRRARQSGMDGAVDGAAGMIAARCRRASGRGDELRPSGCPGPAARSHLAGSKAQARRQQGRAGSSPAGLSCARAGSPGCVTRVAALGEEGGFLARLVRRGPGRPAAGLVRGADGEHLAGRARCERRERDPGVLVPGR
jgi:hypothetical protein